MYRSLRCHRVDSNLLIRKMVGAATFWILLTALTVSVAHRSDNNASNTLSRKKRYVVFPDGATLLARYSVATNLIGVKEPNNWFHVIELDAIYKLPNTTRILPPKTKVKKRKKVSHFIYKKKVYEDKNYYYKHRRDRRDVYEEIIGMLQMQGLDGRACVLRAMCEVRHFLAKSKDLSIFEEIFLTVFTVPPGKDDVFENEDIDYQTSTQKVSNCEEWTSRCHVSLLDFIFSNANMQF